MFRIKGLISALCTFVLGILLLSSCTDNSAFNNTVTIDPKGWFSYNKAVFDIKLKEAGKYAIYLNLRHTDDYKYSNIFLRMYIKNPDSTMQNLRIVEVKLAEKEGKWMGKGSGKLLARKVFITDKVAFAKPGNYRIDLEQYMRDEPLKEISDVGLQLVKE